MNFQVVRITKWLIVFAFKSHIIARNADGGFLLLRHARITTADHKK